MNKRIEQMKRGLFAEFEKKKEWIQDNLTILDDDAVKQEPIVVRRALACNYLLSKLPAEIREYELIVGLTALGSNALGFVFPKYALPKEIEKSVKEGFSEKSIFGHHPLNIEKYLKWGLSGYRQRITEKLNEELGKAEEERRQSTINLYRAMLINLDGLQALANRYSNLALEMGLKEKNEHRRKELFTIHRMLKRVPEQAPQTFYEALQCHWLLHCAMHCCGNRIPIGRVDQFFYPFFKRDIENGVITKEEAKVLLAAWLIKFSDRVMINYNELRTMEPIRDNGMFSTGIAPLAEDMSESYIKSGIGSLISSLLAEDSKDRLKGMVYNSNMQNAILSGQDKDGNDVTNELTYLILETWNELELVHPVLSVRFSDKAPEKLYRVCADILRKGSGDPALYNDKVIIDGLVRTGVPLEEARCYSNDGCWEVLIPGKTTFTTQMLNIAQMVEFVLFRGWSLLRKRKEGFDTGDPLLFKSFDDFYNAYLQQITRTLDRIIERRHKNYRNAVNIAPDAFTSIFIDDCIENGREMVDGGARYNINAPSLGGFTNAVDSLAAIKKLVYEDKVFTMAEIIDACKNNFEGYESMRQKLINWAPKFGNDDDYVDAIAIRLLDDCAKHVEMLNKKYPGARSTLIIGTFERAADFGAMIGATPDGRKAEEPISNNYSPMTGRDINGPTAVMKSITKPNLLPYYCGCPLDIQINANEVDGEAGLNKLVALIRSFMELGGTILTITGVSKELLTDAQKNPEKHRGLRVRLGGLSAYFISLPRDYQNMLIERVKHSV